MNLESFYKYRLSKRGDRTLSFDRDTLVFKVKMFALSSLSQWKRRAFGEFEMRARTGTGTASSI
jgi:hypothetical protein